MASKTLMSFRSHLVGQRSVWLSKDDESPSSRIEAVLYPHLQILSSSGVRYGIDSPFLAPGTCLHFVRLQKIDAWGKLPW